ncbi:hypothetical protein [Streptomyces sp. NPDC005167]
MTALLILAVVFGPSVAFVALRLWVTRNHIPEEARAAIRAELAARFDTYATRTDQLPVKGDR